MAENQYVLEVKNISKSFPNAKVLTDVSLDIRYGEVHALVGENGAGKSTLMKIIMGLYKSDNGDIYFEGQPVSFRDATESLNAGISMIHQELSVLAEMTVAENIFIGRESRHHNTPFIDKKTQNDRAKRLLEQYNMDQSILPRMKVKELNIAQMQMIEIIKAVSYHAKVIIMDEPTSSLSEKETTELFKMINKLKQSNVSIIYITHRMDEIFELADRVSVLRDGTLVSSQDTANITRDQLISMMVGCELNAIYPENKAQKGDVLLEIKNFNKKGVFENISLKVRSGEILGMAGLVGAGRSEVMRAIVGYDRLDSGEIYLNGAPIRIKHPRDAKKNRIALVSEDRKALGLVLCRSVKENIALQNLGLFSRNGFMQMYKEKQSCADIAKKMKVKMSSIAEAAENLSGGNQQKVVLAKCILSQPQILIIDEPTRGIDIGSKAEIYRIMVDLANSGVAIIMISSEMPELMGMSDRIVVMSGGKITGELTQKEKYSQETILDLAFGGV